MNVLGHAGLGATPTFAACPRRVANVCSSGPQAGPICTNPKGRRAAVVACVPLCQRSLQSLTILPKRQVYVAFCPSTSLLSP